MLGSVACAARQRPLAPGAVTADSAARTREPRDRPARASTCPRRPGGGRRPWWRSTRRERPGPAARRDCSATAAEGLSRPKAGGNSPWLTSRIALSSETNDEAPTVLPIWPTAELIMSGCCRAVLPIDVSRGTNFGSRILLRSLSASSSSTATSAGRKAGSANDRPSPLAGPRPRSCVVRRAHAAQHRVNAIAVALEHRPAA